MSSRKDVDSRSLRAAGDELLAGLAHLAAKLDAELEHRGALTSDSFDGVTADRLFDEFFDRLRTNGVRITPSQFVR